LWSADKGRKESKTALTERFYLADASFLAALGGEDTALVGEIADALQNPRWPLFLGRRSCAPSRPVYEGLCELEPEEALRTAPLAEPDRSRAGDRVRLVLEADPGSGRPRTDEPLSFDPYARRFALRYVRTDHVERDALPEVP
jgi:CRISPR system Cascade subunit CasD